MSPLGDVRVAEDGAALRLALMLGDRPPRPLLQMTRGGSELAGPAFTPDGSRLYFSSQRGPSGLNGRGKRGVIYELSIPARFRRSSAAQAAAAPPRAVRIRER